MVRCTLQERATTGLAMKTTNLVMGTHTTHTLLFQFGHPHRLRCILITFTTPPPDLEWDVILPHITMVEDIIHLFVCIDLDPQGRLGAIHRRTTENIMIHCILVGKYLLDRELTAGHGGARRYGKKYMEHGICDCKRRSSGDA